MQKDMKKLFSKLMLVAMAAMTFTACEDVPEPYGKPYEKGGGNTEIEGAKGTGTKDDPFNAIAALNYGNGLASGEISGDYYYIKGKVVSVKEEFTTQYGNGTFYISEDGTSTNQFYAYRVMYLGNKKFANGDTQIAVGDDVIICAKITNYNGTIETAQKEGFLYELNGENRGGEPNNSSDNEGTPTGDGTLENPYNAAAAIAYCKEVGDTESPKDVYIKGKVVSVTESYSTQYGNATFVISDDGTAATTGFTVFRALYLGNKKYTSGDQIKEGDDVIVCGKVTNYRGNTPETVQNKAFLYSLNGKSEGGGGEEAEAKGTGTLADPYNAAAANNVAGKLANSAVSDQAYYIKGKVSRIATDKNGNVQNFDYGTYGNASFYISDDGTETGEFYCYRVLYLENAKWEQGAGDVLKVGDEVVVYAKLTNYNGTSETAQNEGYLYSLNGTTKRSGGGGESGDAKGTGTQTDPFNAAAANNAAAKLADKEVSTQTYYIKGKVAKIATDKNGNVQNFDYGTYGNASFYISDDGADNGTFYCYRVLYLENAKWEEGAGNVLKVGDEVVVCAKLTNYSGTYETAQNEGYLYSLNGNTKRQGGGGGGEEQGGTGSLDAPNTVAQALTVINGLADGATTSDFYYVKGKVAKISTAAGDIGPNSTSGKNYKDINYYISDDGSEGTTIYVYRGKNLNNTDFTSADQLQVGDEVIVYGKLQKYKNNSGEIVPEMAQGNYIVKTSNTGGGGQGGGEQGGGGETAGEGSYSQPYNVAAVIANGTSNTKTGVYVKGYIVGWVSGQVLASGAAFNSECTVKTNILIADKASETDVNNCVPVQLPNNAVRTGLNLQDHPEFYGKEVILYGNLEKYFGAAGIKSVTYAESNGQQIGTKP